MLLSQYIIPLIATYLTKGWPVEDIESQEILQGTQKMMILLAVSEKKHICTSVDP